MGTGSLPWKILKIVCATVPGFFWLAALLMVPSRDSDLGGVAGFAAFLTVTYLLTFDIKGIRSGLSRGTLGRVPGFRSGSPWKIAVACLVYGVWFWIEIDDVVKVLHHQEAIDLWVGPLCISVIWYVLGFNIGGVRQKLSRRPTWYGWIGWAVAGTVLTVAVTSSFSPAASPARSEPGRMASLVASSTRSGGSASTWDQQVSQAPAVPKPSASSSSQTVPPVPSTNSTTTNNERAAPPVSAIQQTSPTTNSQPTPQTAVTSPAPTVSAPKAPDQVQTKPTASPAAKVVVTSITSPIRHGANATVWVETNPGANCDINVFYKSGASTAAGLYPKKADGDGKVSWTWMVGTRTTPGDWPVVVTCDKATTRTTITVN